MGGPVPCYPEINWLVPVFLKTFLLARTQHRSVNYLYFLIALRYCSLSSTAQYSLLSQDRKVGLSRDSNIKIASAFRAINKMTLDSRNDAIA